MLAGAGDVEIDGLVELCLLGGVIPCTIELDIDRTAMDELADGARLIGAEVRDGPEERLEGEVAIFAISRPNSPIRPWTSASSSRSSEIAASPFTISPVRWLWTAADPFSFSVSFSTSHFSTSSMRSSRART